MNDLTIETVKKDISKGTKLIFVEDGGVLSAVPGYVYTFSNWYIDRHGEETYYFQCQELIDMGNLEHNFHVWNTEIFDKNIHKDYVLVTPEILRNGQKEFIKKYGD